MARRELTMGRFTEIKRLLELKIPLRQISTAMKCSRRTIREIRDGERKEPSNKGAGINPIWAMDIVWEEVMKEINEGHPLKYIWKEAAKDKTAYVNFWRQFHKRYPEYGIETVVHRVFEPADRCEVDYAGDTIAWLDTRAGILRKANVFVGVLGFSQMIFACAKENMKSPNFLDCHNKMFEYFGGVPKIIVPDCLKQGVAKTHLYDPDINEGYQELAKYYNTAVVPARVAKPKDKSLVEGAVKIVMKRFNWKFRNYTFTSIVQINRALKEVCDEINNEEHTRFKISRYKKWEESERYKLTSLPNIPFEIVDWKEAKLHPDSHIFIEGTYYSAPHIHRGKEVKVKLTSGQIEIFYNLERIAVHERIKGSHGKFITNFEHLPPNAKAYYEATPQNLLTRAERLSGDLYQIIDGLFQKNAIAHIRRVQGFVREAEKEISLIGYELGRAHIKKACDLMCEYDKIRVPYFRDLLNQFRIEELNKQEDSIKRKPNNDMLRYSQQTMLQ